MAILLDSPENYPKAGPLQYALYTDCIGFKNVCVCVFNYC